MEKTSQPRHTSITPSPVPPDINVGDAPQATPEDQVTTIATLSVGCKEGHAQLPFRDTVVGVANFFPSPVLEIGVLHGLEHSKQQSDVAIKGENRKQSPMTNDSIATPTENRLDSSCSKTRRA